MTAIHEDLENATFTRPNGIVEETVCRTTGCLATTGCANTYTEIFTQDNIPEKCEGHGSQTICSESKLVATEYCSQYCAVTQNYYGAVLPKEQLNLWKPLSGGSASGTRINEICTLHTKPKEKEPEKPKPNTNTTNTASGGNTTGSGNTTSGGNATSGGNTTDGGSGSGGEKPADTPNNTTSTPGNTTP